VPDGYIVIRPSPERDRDGSKLRQTLEAQVAIERAHALRLLLVHVVAWLSVPVGIGAAWPAPPAGMRGLFLAGWATSLVGALIAGTAEWKHHRRRSGLLADMGCPQRPGA
jgi:hypothetical protein